MFPHGASPRRRPAYNPRPYHAPAQVDPPFFQHRAVDGYDVPVHDSLPIYDWKPRPLAPPPPPHIMENWRKRKHEDHDSPIVKRLRGDASSSLPSSRHPVSRHTHPSFSPDHAVAGSSRSSSVFSHPHSHVHPHVPAIPRSSTNMHFFADDKLSAQVMKLFEMCQQQSSDLCQKEKCRSWLQRDERVSEMGRLYMTGSTMSGLASRSSDADLCYVLHESKKADPIAVLSALQRIMRSMIYVERMRLIRAKVPILRFQEKGSNLVFDLNVNNTVGIRNTFLLKSYAYVEPRIRPLIVVIKKWARHHQINDASQGTLSSYALVLMVLHYLQTLKEPVLPSLQMDFPECFDPSLEIDRIPEAAKNIPRYNSQNQSSLGTLLLGFLRYYATEFSWKKSVISVRAGKALPKQNHPKWNDKLICVEEPFERKNVARAVFKQAKFDAIKSQFLESWQILWKEMDLNSILPVQDIIEEETSWK
ncbi:poly(A) RNA polymerase GLD2 isoform X1 [Phyllopteryx taeniolatus]|uniref:poly(A) RNA polymerase GLD2 isoform X1 n=1 Tax=Phyllopteryx taeniolatus TaxID=161469 RepID=UPI002AD38DE0|nr:poly(A) RNA polymerase GLD2 isoform X1 [Phyllopteryx taeniolatus]